MTANSDAEDYLNYFLDSKSNPDFGILLDGPWGCGKTHFIKEFLNKRNLIAKQSDPLAGSVYLYASLYGVRSRNEITEQFFVQSHPILSSRPMQIIGSTIAGVLRKFGPQLSESEKSAETVKEMVLDLSGKILVFDDLERSAMPTSEAMGYINTFVEHRGLANCTKNSLIGLQRKNLRSKEFWK